VKNPNHIAGVALRREEEHAFKGMILKHGLNVDILGIDSCKMIIDFLEKAED
jgi:hypothetical protein